MLNFLPGMAFLPLKPSKSYWPSIWRIQALVLVQCLQLVKAVHGPRFFMHWFCAADRRGKKEAGRTCLVLQGERAIRWCQSTGNIGSEVAKFQNSSYWKPRFWLFAQNLLKRLLCRRIWFPGNIKPWWSILVQEHLKSLTSCLLQQRRKTMGLYRQVFSDERESLSLSC